MLYLTSMAAGVVLAILNVSWLGMSLIFAFAFVLLFLFHLNNNLHGFFFVITCFLLGFFSMWFRLQNLASQVPEDRFFSLVKGQVDKVKNYQTGAMWTVLRNVHVSSVASTAIDPVSDFTSTDTIDSMTWKALGSDFSLRIFVKSSELSALPIEHGDWLTLTNVRFKNDSYFKDSEDFEDSKKRLSMYDLLPSSFARVSQEQILQITPDTPAYLSFWYEKLESQIGHTSSTGRAFVDAMLTGRRQSAGFKELIQVLRPAGLSHVVAISGLHMSLLANFAFWIVILITSCFSVIYLHFSLRKIAAIVSMALCFIYLIFTDFPLTAQRAFIMIAIFLSAIVIDRRASGIRSLSLAGIALLILWPEYLLHVGLQFSFMSVLILLCIYEDYKKRHESEESHDDLTGLRNIRLEELWLLICANFLLVTTNNVIQIYHFSVVYPYALLSNLILLPLFTLIVMPLVFLSIPLVLLEIAWPILSIIDFIMNQILWIASGVKHLPLYAPDVHWSGEFWMLVFVSIYCCFLFERITYKPVVVILLTSVVLMLL